MAWGCDNAHHQEHNGNASVVTLNALRVQTLKRLSGVHKKLETKGIGDAFTRAAKVDHVGDMGLFGSLILDMMVGGALSSFFGSHAFEAFHHAASATLEGVSLLTDQDAREYRSRVSSDYPYGRRKCTLAEATVAKKFNLVSANQNGQFSYDVRADLACMYEILDMLDKMQSEGIVEMRLDRRESVYSVLKRNDGKMFGKGAVRSYAAPVRVAI